MSTITKLLLVAVLMGNLVNGVPAAQPGSGSVMFKFTSDGEPAKNVTVDIRLTDTVTPGTAISATRPTDQNGSLIFDNIRESTYSLRFESIGFEAHSVGSVVVLPGQVNTIAVSLDKVQEIPFTRVEESKIREFISRCNGSPWSTKKIWRSYLVVSDAESWTKLWTDYNAVAPDVDFTKYRVVGRLQDKHGPRYGFKVRRVTYNPKKQQTIVRFSGSSSGSPQLAVIECDADFVLIPAGPSRVAFG